jgi:hypothetical protein
LPVILGVGVVAAAAIGFFALSGSGESAPPATPAPASQPAAPAAQSSPAAPTVQMSSAKQGKTPTTPPPPLTQATLQELSNLLEQVKALRNEAVTARTGSADNAKARAKMAEAHKLLQQWQQMISAQLKWQETAQWEDWAQPAEYATLEKLFSTFSRLDNEVRKGGGG